jgi:O-antigen/teichoic acid export membrane protein
MPSFVKALKSRIYAYAVSENTPISGFLSPAVQSFRLADGFVRNVLVLLSGTTAATLIPTVIAPILSRIYTPEAYGVFALYVSIVSVIVVVINCGYDAAIVLPKKDEEGWNLVGLCFAVSVVGCLLLSGIGWFFSVSIATLLGSPGFSSYVPTVPLTGLLLGLHQTLTLWANRKKQFRKLATNRIVDSSFNPAPSIVMGFLGFGAIGLIIGFLVGKVAAVWDLAMSLRRDKRMYGLHFERSAMLRLAGKFSDFPSFYAPTSLLDVLAMQVPLLFLAKIFGPVVVGLFAMVNRVIASPLTFVGSSVSQVYYQWVAEASFGRTSLKPYVLKVAAYLSLAVLGPLLIVILFAPSLFAFVFGEQWRTSGEYARILILPIAIKFIVSPLGSVLPATGNVRMGSLWRIAYFSGTLIVLLAASSFQPKTFLYMYSLYDVVFYVCYFFLILKVSASMRISDITENRA